MKHLLIATYFIGLGLFAQQQVFDTQQSKGKLYEYAQFTNVGDSIFSINNILEKQNLQYQPLTTDYHSLGFTTSNYWVRFNIKNSSNQPKSFYLETGRPITDVANLYQINGSTIHTFKSGDKIPINDKQIKHRATIFKLNLPPNEVQEVYIHLSSDGETINLPLNLYSETEFLLLNYKQQLFLGLFYGLLFLATIIYLFFYTSLKKNTFLYYGLYVLSIGLMQAALDGLLHEYIFTQGGYINDRLVLITALFSNFFLLKYSKCFLDVNTHLKGFKKAYNIAYAFIGICFILLFINKKTLEIAYPLSNLNGLFSLVLILATSFTMRFKRIKIDPFFSFGIFFLVIGLLGFVMNNLSLLPNNFFTLNSAKFGSGFEVIFLSLSMTNLIRNLRLEKETSQEEALNKSQEISALKTYFMSNMSHELRTPINAIMGIAESELTNLENNTDRKPYEIIKNASLSLLSNVNDILDFEKIEKNELQLEPSEFSPSIKINQISNNWKAEALNKGLDYIFEMDPEIPSHVIADEKRFIQIINKVLSNAVKFTKTGSIYFKVTCLKQPNNLCRFSLQISDTGVGIKAEAKKSIFDSFSQMKLNHKRQFGGIGLGLTIAKKIIELFNGQITIESEENRGTDVFIDLPLKTIAKERILDLPKTNKPPLHILVVEDNKLNQMVMRKILSSEPNFTFAIAHNGHEALETLKKDIYDLVLMDLQMPIMDGYEATEIIRKGGIGNAVINIPIIAVTADALPETKARALQLGMNDYLTKPIDKDLLINKIYNNYYAKNSKTLKIA
ncbi:hybrid sensor histidine kinase/response regulator [Neotamlana nanhaiensis]|uniref:hybrid sensor histidine kinase/response regulator n=1 Tax=Neotamlana nanhaiensis TaxID=1382798 RepID=UPI0005CBEDA2|nr:hybrid sensor histidine kinase/response regulator [Tamlana nanhaiensis]